MDGVDDFFERAAEIRAQGRDRDVQVLRRLIMQSLDPRLDPRSLDHNDLPGVIPGRHHSIGDALNPARYEREPRKMIQPAALVRSGFHELSKSPMRSAPVAPAEVEPAAVPASARAPSVPMDLAPRPAPVAFAPMPRPQPQTEAATASTEGMGFFERLVRRSAFMQRDPNSGDYLDPELARQAQGF